MHHLLEHINQDIKRRQSKDKDSKVIKFNTGANEIQQLNPRGPDNSQNIRPITKHKNMYEQNLKTSNSLEGAAAIAGM